MREYLFRGKRLDNGEWFYGCYQEYPNNEVCIQNTYRDSYFVSPETVGQFTEILDKNGKKIFEGDIVYLSENVKQTFDVDDGVIIYNHGAFFVNNADSLRSTLFALTDYTFVLRGRVIGNIHDNPELLEEK